jgi:protein-L-isoaspartate(D-aspartate) O-methyltransferase
MAEKKSQVHDWVELRRRMVEEQIRRRGVHDRQVLDAMMTVPRERFIPQSARSAAYDDRALAIGHDQTISQPYIVAYMMQQLAITPEARILEIGTGTGYQTALLALLAAQVFSVERIPALKEQAAKNLATLDLANVTMTVGDGSLGWREHAPYDRILATAAAPNVPGGLVDQLVEGGVLVIPVGGKAEQTIVRVVREGSRTIETTTLACRFVKLIGQAGWNDDQRDG